MVFVEYDTTPHLVLSEFCRIYNILLRVTVTAMSWYVGPYSVSKGIQRDVLELYETIVLVLVEDHPHVGGAAVLQEARRLVEGHNLALGQSGMGGK